MVYTSVYKQQVTEESGITNLHYQGQELHFFRTL
jgi:hypothetical protein